MAYYAQGGPIPLFHRAEAINNSSTVAAKLEGTAAAADGDGAGVWAEGLGKPSVVSAHMAFMKKVVDPAAIGIAVGSIFAVALMIMLIVTCINYWNPEEGIEVQKFRAKKVAEYTKNPAGGGTTKTWLEMAKDASKTA